MGQQRSAMIISCYLMKSHNMKLEETLEKIKLKRKYAFLPEATFIDFLKYYELEQS
jgi:protein-tyrosine phosphatase